MRVEIMSLQEACRIYGVMREFLPPDLIDSDEFMCKVTHLSDGYRFTIFDKSPRFH